MAKKQRQYPQQKSRNNNKSNIVFDVRQAEPHLVKAEPDVRKKFTKHDLKRVTPMTENQMLAFQEWAQGQHLVLEGYAGVGKSFLAMYMALNTILDPSTEQDKIIIIRSAVPTRDSGFLPGTLEEKNAVFEEPYVHICNQLFSWKNSYNNLKEIGLVEFHTTSYLRGATFENAVVIFDEMQSCTAHELSTVITRLGNDSRLIMCGDDLQNDIGGKSGMLEIIPILRRMEIVSFVDFKLADIVRSGFVREFLMAKYSR